MENLSAAIATADHVINILPDNAASRNFMNAARFAQMKPGAVFHNIGRGTTVDQDALFGALRSGHLGAAWLDVTEPEPRPPTIRCGASRIVSSLRTSPAAMRMNQEPW